MALCLVCGNPQSNPECRCEEYSIRSATDPLDRQLKAADSLVRALEKRDCSGHDGDEFCASICTPACKRCKADTIFKRAYSRYKNLRSSLNGYSDRHRA